MSHPDRVVVKVGGSLYDHPNLKDGLKAWLAARPERHILIVPGGGDFAEAVRRLDTVHGLGEKVSHRLALNSLAVAAMFLHDILDTLQAWDNTVLWGVERLTVLIYAQEWLNDYQSRHPQRIPKSWEFTTDSLAACAAHDAGCKLVLLKSVDIPPTMSWQQAADRGHVDAYFPTLVARHSLRVTAVNFRAVLDQFPASGVA